MSICIRYLDTQKPKKPLDNYFKNEKKIRTFETALDMMFRCRIEEFSSIVPDQPKLSTNSTGEVFSQKKIRLKKS